MTPNELLVERLRYSVVGAFYEVYNTLGFGFLEHVYVTALERELLARKHRVGREVWVPVFYKGEPIANQRIDMVVDETLVVEAKSTVDLHRAAKRQLQSYLGATRLGYGLLLHFGPEARYAWIHRVGGCARHDSKAVSGSAISTIESNFEQ